MTKQELNLLLENVEILDSSIISKDDTIEYDPAETYTKDGDKYVWARNELSHEEIMEALPAKNLQQTRAIRQMLTFWILIIIIGLFFIFMVAHML